MTSYDSDWPLEQNVSTLFQAVLEQRQQDVMSYLAREEGYREDFSDLVQSAESVAEALWDQSENLAGAGLSESLSVVLASVDDDLTRSLVADALQRILASFSIHSLETAEQRMPMLLSLLKESQPHPEAVGFIARAARCFLFGFDAECLILCRSVLDAQLKGCIANAEIEAKEVKYRGRLQINLYGRIEAACRNHPSYTASISLGTAKEAHALRLAANEYLHQGREPSADPAKWLTAVVHVLSEISAE